MHVAIKENLGRLYTPTKVKLTGRINLINLSTQLKYDDIGNLIKPVANYAPLTRTFDTHVLNML